MWLNLLAVFLGGGLGSLSRYGVSTLTARFFSGEFPLATLLSNTLSCAVLGWFAWQSTSPLPAHWRLLLITGFCGGFSTFSAFGFETINLVKSGNYLFAGLNVLVSIVACLLILLMLYKNS